MNTAHEATDDMADFERDQIGERTKLALAHKKAVGEVYAATPYGFDAIEGRLVEVKREAKVVAEILKQRNAECYYRHGCKGPCDQGDKPCPCPDACEQDDQSNSADATFIPFLLVMFLFFILACVSLWHVIARVYE